VGLVVAVLAFGLLRTVVHAWYAGADMASAPAPHHEERHLARVLAAGLLPRAHPRGRWRQQGGDLNWFGGIYKDQSFGNFFAQFAIDGPYFDMYPEFVVKPEELAAWKPTGAGPSSGASSPTARLQGGRPPGVEGRDLPGRLGVQHRAIYEPRDDTTVTRQMYFHWEYLNEQMKKRFPRRAEFAGVFVVQIADGSRAAEISQVIDREFRNRSPRRSPRPRRRSSWASSPDRGDRHGPQDRLLRGDRDHPRRGRQHDGHDGARAARRVRDAEGLGFGPGFVGALIVGESVLMTAIGGALGIALTFPVAAAFKKAMGSMFPVFNVTDETIAMQIAAALLVGVLAAIVPSIRAAAGEDRRRLRYIG
jgi:putative ABC transport system permease protein